MPVQYVIFPLFVKGASDAEPCMSEAQTQFRKSSVVQAGKLGKEVILLCRIDSQKADDTKLMTTEDVTLANECAVNGQFVLRITSRPESDEKK